jgi:anaerobic selenocysteine-containing dehydrogenase
MEEFITACPRNCYSTCSFRVQVENNKIRRILPYEGNLATPEGPCIKGLSYIERAHSEKRIKHALLKNSNGGFEQISLNEAFDLISRKLSEIRQNYGPQSILWYTGSGNSGLTNEIGTGFWKSFGGATTTYGNLCWPAGLEAVRLTMGSVKHNVPWDLVNARTIVIWGKNPAETNIQEMAFIASAKEKGCRIIVIDLRRTPTADKADLLICPHPGTDGALALAMAKVIADENLTDNEFLGKHVLGFDEFRNSLKITPEEAESITGVPAKTIKELARIIAAEGPVTILPGYGLQRHSNGGQTIRCLLALTIMTGNIGKSGAGFNYANLQGYVFDRLKEPLSYYPDPAQDMPFRRSLSMAKLGTDIPEQSNPPVKAAWIERGNPVLQSPDSKNVIKAFSQLEFRVVVDQFMTDTAAMADIILPAKDIFEQSDIISSYWSPYIQFKPKILQPEGDVMPESEIYYHLAKRMELNIGSDLLPEPGNENIENWLEKRIKGFTRLTLSDLRKGPVLAPGLQETAYSDMKFGTFSGKIELLSSDAGSKWCVSELPGFESLTLTDEQKKYPLSFITPNTGPRIHSQFGNLEIIKSTVPPPALEISPADALIRNISTGDRVRVFNSSGEIFSVANVTDRLPSGLVVLPNGIWLNEGGGGNMLTSPQETDMGFGSAFHDARIEVEKVPVP